MNIQSNALKFTKDNGEVHVVCQYVRGTDKKRHQFGKSKDDFVAAKSKEVYDDVDDENNDSAASANEMIENDKAFRFLDF